MLLRSLLSLLLCTLASLQAAQEAPAPAMPAVQALPDAHLYALVIIPDLHRALEHLQSVVTTVAPAGSMPSTAADSLALVLHDPGLKNLAATPVLLLVMPGVPTPSFACILPCTKAQDYADAATQGGLAAKVVGNLAIIAQAPDAIDQALPLATRYQEITAHLPVTDLRLLVAPDRLTVGYGPMLKMLLKTMLPIPPTLKSVVSAELTGVLAILGDLDEVQCDITLVPGNLLISQVQVARPGSDLAKALVQSKPHVPSASSRLPDHPILLGMSAHFNAVALSAYYATLVHAIGSDPSSNSLLTPKVVDDLDKCFSLQSGDLAMEVMAKQGGWALYNEVVAANDPAALVANQEDLISALSSVSQSMGSTITPEVHVRSVGTIAIDRFTTKVDTSKLPAASQAKIATMTTPTELAAKDGFMYVSQDPADLDAMLTGSPKGLTLKASSILPAGMDGYVDCDLPSIISALSVAIAPVGVGAVVSVASEPLTGCWACASGHMQAQVRIPLSTLAAVSAQVQGAMAQFGAAKAQRHAGAAGPGVRKAPPAVF